MPSEPGAAAHEGMIPLSVPEIGGNEWEYIKECLDTNWVSSAGSFVDRFEDMVAERVGARYAVATVNGTAALHIALLVAGIEPDDEVVVSSVTFIAPANAIRYVGAWPVFMDAEPDYWQMDTEKLKSFLERGCEWKNGVLRNLATGRRVRAILPVHILGHPCDMDLVLELAAKYELIVVEDASESLGAQYNGRMVGHLGDVACFSFNGNKLITTGGGGMIVTDNEEWATRTKYLTTQAKDDPVEYIHGEIGYNFRLTNILAALGVAQMEQLDKFLEKKRDIARRYDELLAEVPGIIPMAEAPWASSAFWLYTVRVDENRYGSDSRDLLAVLQQQGVQTRPLWEPLHLSIPHKTSQAWDVQVADLLYTQCLSLPCSVGLSEEEQERVIRLVAKHDG